MPAIILYGRRWHFSSDIVPVPAGLFCFYHASWVIILLVSAGVTDSWPRSCSSSEGQHYIALFILFFAACLVAIPIEAGLFYWGMQGGPFEQSKRKPVVPLLYASTFPLAVQAIATVYGSWVTTTVQPDCWPDSRRNGLTNFAQGMVFSSWGVLLIVVLGITIFYNAYPDQDSESWEERWGCVARWLCCSGHMYKRPEGKRPPIKSIAELTSGLVSHVDLDATDLTAALMLTAAAQSRRRRLRVARALLPVYQAMASSLGDGPPSDFLHEEEEEEEVDDVDDDTITDSSSAFFDAIPNSKNLTRQLSLIDGPNTHEILSSIEEVDITPEVVEQLGQAIETQVEELGSGNLAQIEEGVIAANKARSLLPDELADENDEEPVPIWVPSAASSEGGDSSLSTTTSPPNIETTERDMPVPGLTVNQTPVITPSEYLDKFEVNLPPHLLTELYVGRHTEVDAETLKDLRWYLKYAFAAYSLTPKLEKPPGIFDLICACYFAGPPDPHAQIFKGMRELESLASEQSIELLHLNFSNAVLTHLPYMVALDHAHKKVVLSIRGTSSLADLITDAVVYPMPVDSWLSAEVKRRLGGGAAVAHAGMVAAAKAIFQDMCSRGMIQELAEQEDTGEFTGGPTHPAAALNEEVQRRNKTGRTVGEIMRHKLKIEGWQFVVVGHSLGAGAAALVSLKLQQHFPSLRCIAYSPPGGAVSVALGRAMAPFTTCVVIGKDLIPRMTVSTLGRLMDELVVAVARCKVPKLKVTFLPWWRRHKDRFKDLFYSYNEIPEECLAILKTYYESRRKVGRPIKMMPPGKLVFLRPSKLRKQKQWDGVWIAAEDLVGEGILLSKHMYSDHLCSTVNDALRAAEKCSREREGAAVEVEKQRLQLRKGLRRVLPHTPYWAQGRGGSSAGHESGGLQQVLIAS